jgi:peptide deformylase
MLYKVVRYMNAPILERAVKPVTEFDTSDLHSLIADMFETMHESHGVGLAANQIDVDQSVTVIDVAHAEAEEGEEAEPNPIVLINPKVVAKTGKQTGEEGCLSIPGFREPVTRARQVKVQAQNVRGETFEIEGEDLLARAMQHEIDHLNGILFINHLSSLKREVIKRKIRRMIQAGEWD